MPKIQQIISKTPVTSNKLITSINSDHLQHLAFDNTAQANIITTASSGKIIMANSAACKLLGYSKKAILTQSRSTIFDIKESSFKKMMKQRTAEGQSKALVTAIKKSGKKITCEITSAVFMDVDGIEKAITSIADMSQSILLQNKIDSKKEKIVADNIVLAKTRQKKIDLKNEKNIVADIKLAKARSDARLAENNEWIKHIAMTSYDVMWDWDIATGKIYAGNSVQEVFGYKLQNNLVLFADFTTCLVAEEKESFQKKLSKALDAGNKRWNDSFKLIRKDGSLASVESRASIIRDEQGKALRLIGAVQDISRMQEMEKKMEELGIAHKEDRDQFLLAAKISFDVIWDRNLLTNEVLRGEGFEELLGYPLKDYKRNVNDWSDHIHPDDKEAVEKGLQEAIESSALNWEHAFRIIKADGSIARVFDRASIFRDIHGKAYRMIGAMTDLTRQRELEEKLEYEIASKEKTLKDYEALQENRQQHIISPVEDKEYFRLLFNSSVDVLFDIDVEKNEVVFSGAYEKEFGYTLSDKMTPEKDWAIHIHPDDKERVYQAYLERIASDDTEWKYQYRFIKADHSVVNILSTGVILRNNDGKIIRLLGVMHDISKETLLEEKLDQQIEFNERQLADILKEAKEAERSEIGKELHDNVNQLLGASRLYLEMAKRGGVDSELYLSRSSEYTLEAIEEIRKLTKGLTTDTIQNLGLCEAIGNIALYTMEVNPVQIACVLDSNIETRVNDKFKLNVFRIVQEQINNILKHSKATNVKIILSQNEHMIALSISDNGVGFDTDKPRKGIGLSNIKGRASFYKAEINLLSQPGKGCTLNITFPITAELLIKN